MAWSGDFDGTGGRSAQRLRLLVADRHPLVTEALAALLVAQGFQVDFRTSNGEGALAIIVEGRVDIAVIDIDLVDSGPASLLRERGDSDVALIFTAPTADHTGVAVALEGGANGLVLKSEAAESLAHCIATVSGGGQWFDLSARDRANDRQHSIGGARNLTRRERDVARLVATGQRNRNIAGTLGISEGTVKMHLHNVYAKLGLESRTQLAMDERLRMMG